MYIIVSVYISRISLALVKPITEFFKTPKMYKVSKCSDINEFLSLKQILASWLYDHSSGNRWMGLEQNYI